MKKMAMEGEADLDLHGLWTHHYYILTFMIRFRHPRPKLDIRKQDFDLIGIKKSQISTQPTENHVGR